MPWLKVSDNAAFHEVVTHPLTEPVPDEPLDGADMVNLAFGLVLRCATHSANFTTDYVVKDGTVALMGGPHWLARAELAARAGYWERIEGGWRILEDSDNFLHIRLKAELDWEKQRRRDTSDVALVVPVRLRDGDQCRYCGLIVNWNDRKSNRGGTYDHKVPGKAATSPDDLLVACQGCNGFRSNRPDANEARPARPAPAQPFYGAATVAFLQKHGHGVPQTPGTQPGTIQDPAASRPSASTTQPTDQPGPPAPRARRDGRGRGNRNPAASRTYVSTTGAEQRSAAPKPEGVQRSAAFSNTRGVQRSAAPTNGGVQRSAASSNTSKARGPDHRPRGAPPHLGSAGSDRYQADPADPRHAVFGSPGRDGTGRVGSSPTSAPYVADPSDHRSRRRTKPPPPAPRHA